VGHERTGGFLGCDAQCAGQPGLERHEGPGRLLDGHADDPWPQRRREEHDPAGGQIQDWPGDGGQCASKPADLLKRPLAQKGQGDVDAVERHPAKRARRGAVCGALGVCEAGPGLGGRKEGREEPHRVAHADKPSTADQARHNPAMAGRTIEFAGNGRPYSGYLAPAEGGGPGVIVIQEWWGLVGHIKAVADRFAAAGFTALAPDFYHGKTASEPDEAGSLMMALQIDDAAKVLDGAATALLAAPECTSQKLGVVGFCMGGQLAMYAACRDPRIGACVNFYGVHPNVKPDFEKLEAPIVGFFGEDDHVTPQSAVQALDAELDRLGKYHEFVTFRGRGHAFFNDERPEVFDQEAADFAWDRTLRLFRESL
jgi:carboxymethylenebutenolidase